MAFCWLYQLGVTGQAWPQPTAIDIGYTHNCKIIFHPKHNLKIRTFETDTRPLSPFTRISFPLPSPASPSLPPSITVGSYEIDAQCSNCCAQLKFGPPTETDVRCHVNQEFASKIITWWSMYHMYIYITGPYDDPVMQAQKGLRVGTSVWRSSLKTGKRPQLDWTGPEKDPTSGLVFWNLRIKDQKKTGFD